MKKKYLIQIPLIILLFSSLAFLISCEDDDDKDKGTELLSFGPSPNLHGGQLVFIGTSLDKVTSITLPGNVEVTNFISKSATELLIEIPHETDIEGKVTLKTPSGDIQSKSNLVILRPVELASFTPATVLPGDVVTISGTYMYLVKEIIFADNKVVTEFESQSETEIQVRVPLDAQSGFIVMSNGDEEEPVFIKSESELTVTLPASTTVSPATIKAGADLTINGTNLDLVEEVKFPGGTIVTTFVSKAADKIVVTVPNNSQDGKVILRPASKVEVETAPITMVIPTISGAAPNPVKTGQNITITGTNLDLVTSVGFGGNVNGEIQAGRTATSISVKVPATAVDGVVKLNTAANKSVSTATPVQMVVPTITNLAPLSVNTADAPSITITGTDLDIVKTIVFKDNLEAAIADATTATATQITIPVIPGSVTGKVKIITTNGTTIESAQTFTIVPDVPNVTGPTSATLGLMLTITGTNMDVIADIYFPGNVIATKYGAKTATSIEVLVPAKGVTPGLGKIKFVTNKNEVYFSPDINFVGLPPLTVVIYDEAAKSALGTAGGWGGVTSDFANTEMPRLGTKAVKVTYPGGWGGGGQFGNWSGGSVSTAGTSVYAFSIYGGPGTDGKEINVNVAGKQVGVVIVEGDWKDVAIPLSDFSSPATVSEVWFQDKGWGGTVYIDQIGFR